MSRYFVPLTAAYPQTGDNRPVSEIIDDLSDYVGHGNRPAAEARARRALQSAVRFFNTMPWKFARFQQDITLANDTSDYTLDAEFRSPRAAFLLDSSDREAGPLEWVMYEDWARYEGDKVSGTATSPASYTARNQHQTGLVTFLPRLGTINTQYPKVRIDFHQRISIPTVDTAILGVPTEVEEAIVQEAVAVIVAKARSFAEAASARAVARDLMARVEKDWRDWPDPGLVAVGSSYFDGPGVW